jgi:hypothetical protein
MATGYVVAGLRRGKVRKHFIGAKQIDVVVLAEPALAFEAIKQVGEPFHVDDSDADSKRIVLSSNPTVFSWGFFYPIEIAPFERGSKITIGIKSKFLWAGSIVTQTAHKRCARAVEATFTAPPMRVV